MSTETDGEFLARVGTDAALWAEEFTKKNSVAAHIESDVLDGWFANAIQAGRSDGQPGPFDIVISKERLATFAYLVAGAAMGIAMQDHPDYVMPTERLGEAVDRMIQDYAQIIDEAEETLQEA